jgi:hypothetical protein
LNGRCVPGSHVTAAHGCETGGICDPKTEKCVCKFDGKQGVSFGGPRCSFNNSGKTGDGDLYR